MYTTTAKFNSKCATTGQFIKKGDPMVYDRKEKKCYLPGHEPSTQDSAAGMIQDNEDAGFDNFCLINNI